MELIEITEKILYIGSGLDLKPIVHFNQVKEFVYIDTLPRSIYDGKIHNGSLFFDKFYKPKFIFTLMEKAQKYNFDLIQKISLDLEYHNKILTLQQKRFWGNNLLEKFPDINPHLLIFTNNSIIY